MLYNKFSRNKKILLPIIFVMIFFILLSFNFFSNQKSDYIIIIDGERISVSEFKLYFYEMQLNFEAIGGYDIWDTDFEGRTALEVAKERTLNSITHIKITANRANSMGLKLLDEDIQTAIYEAEQVLNYYDDDVKNYLGITLEQLTKIMEQKTLRNKVYNEVTKNYQISDTDFEKYYQQYLEEENSDKTLTLEEIKNTYVNLMKDEIFESEYKKWSNEVSIEINETQWDKINIFERN